MWGRGVFREGGVSLGGVRVSGEEVVSPRGVCPCRGARGYVSRGCVCPAWTPTPRPEADTVHLRAVIIKRKKTYALPCACTVCCSDRPGVAVCMHAWRSWCPHSLLSLRRVPPGPRDRGEQPRVAGRSPADWSHSRVDQRALRSSSINKTRKHSSRMPTFRLPTVRA